MAQIFSPNDPTFSPIPNRTLGNEKPLPGESWAQFLQRTKLYEKLATPEDMQQAEDAFKVQALQQQEEAKSRGILGEQSDIASKRLNDLTSLLAKQQDTAFNRSIPELAGTAQGQGLLETSGFGNALANKYKELTADTSTELAKQALADRDIQIQGLGGIATNANNLSTSGLERTFSSEDLTKSEALARELAKYGVPAPTPQPSTTDKILQYSGPILSGVGAVKGA